MRTKLLFLFALGLATENTFVVRNQASEQTLPSEAPVSFQGDIRPILADHCFACHGPDAQHRQANLRLDVAEKVQQAEAIVPGDLERSKVWERIVSEDTDAMMPPPDFHKPLSNAQKELIRRWIVSGAEYQQHWSFVAPAKPPIPSGNFDNPIDAFLAPALAAAGLASSPLADRQTLIRRLTLDLTGLPPTPAEVEAFVKDPSVDFYEKAVDQLMNRTGYGQQMARYWLDLARYADTHGLHLDNERSIWPYRDWVVQAFLQNIPFDDFTRWQLAGDLLPEPTREQLVASGFNRCNVSTSEGGSINEEWIYRYAVDRTTTTVEVWMGLTAGCAVCHDHKFDPLSSRDFYSLYAFFHSAADPAMDGNKADTPPILKLYEEADRATVAAIDEQLAMINGRLKQAIAAIRYDDPAKQAPPPEPEVVQTGWFDDAFPAGANVQSRGAPLQLISANEGPVHSGKQSLRRTALGLEQDYFESGAEPLTVPKDGTVVVHCYLDTTQPPEAIMLQFHTDGWKHRAVWGKEEKIPYGKSGSTEKVLMGRLPELGRWVRLEVPAAKMGLKAGDQITGFAFTQFAGTVHWDQLLVEAKLDRKNDPTWSFEVWKSQNVGIRVNELPEGLQQLVRGKKAIEWTDTEADDVFQYWKGNFYAGAVQSLASLKAEQSAIVQKKQAIDASVPLTFVMADLPQPRESFVMLRGAYDKPGEKVTRGVPEFLPPLPARTSSPAYNRLDLANWLVSGQHPLTARVAVNRFWQQFFGRGLVETSADFGAQGTPPSHPELLDWLAVTFVEDGWDVKRLLKRMLTSHAYRQSSFVTQHHLAADPENRLLARAPRIRLDAEVLRDQALFVSGLLVDQIGGPGVKPYQPPNIWEPVGFGNSNTRYYTQGKGTDLYRRSLYTFLKRTAPPPFMSTFDAPNREQSCTRRGRSNTPMQALQLMNDIQHVEAARHLAQRTLLEGGTTIEQRVDWIWRQLLGRFPEPNERQIAIDALTAHLARFGKAPESAKSLVSFGDCPRDPGLAAETLAAYTMLANLVMNLDETITKN